MVNFRTNALDGLPSTLIIFGGLPGTGKTTIARELSKQLGAMYLRIDSIEQAIRDSGAIAKPIGDAGYRAAYAIAEDNLRLGRTVIADSVNPIRLSRDSWISVANRSQVRVAEVEIICSDRLQHRQRVEARRSDIKGLRLPTWAEVISREYEPWDRQHIVIDTAGRPVIQSTQELSQAIATLKSV